MAANAQAPKVGFLEAVKLFFKNYTNFKGRSRRSEYWWVYLFNILVSGILGALVPQLVGIWTLAILLPTLALCVRRLHDTGHSGWYYLLILVPLVGAIILIVWFCTDSKEDNQWGPNPKRFSSYPSDCSELFDGPFWQEHSGKGKFNPNTDVESIPHSGIYPEERAFSRKQEQKAQPVRELHPEWSYHRTWDTIAEERELSRRQDRKAQPVRDGTIPLDSTIAEPTVYDPEPFELPEPKKPMTTLYMASGPMAGTSFKHAAGTNVTLGRNPGKCDIVLKPYEVVSGLHCQIGFFDSYITITDLNSTNGTLVNGVRLTPNKTVAARNGATIQLANATCTIKVRIEQTL